MKKYLIALVALVLFTITTNAQGKRFAWNKKNMTEIGLTEEQQAKVNTIKSSSDAEIKTVKDDATMAEDAKKTKLQELQKKRMASIDAVLTDEQKKKVEEMKAKAKTEGEAKQ